MTEAAYNQVVNAPHKASLTNEVLSAAAGWQAMKAWNEHKAKNGETVDHAKMKQFLAAAGAVFIDRIAETKGHNALDRHRAKKLAEVHYEKFEQYGNQGNHGHHEHHEHREHHFGHHHHHRR